MKTLKSKKILLSEKIQFMLSIFNQLDDLDKRSEDEEKVEVRGQEKGGRTNFF